MNAVPLSAPSDAGLQRGSEPLLRTLVLCDLVNSTALVERLGDHPASELMRRHDRMARDLVQHYNGREIDKTDGFLVMFERPIQGVAFALAYQRELRRLGREASVPLQSRIGIHVGDVCVWENSASDIARGAKPVEVEGLVKPVAARLASLALPNQVLASGVAAGLAQRAHAELGEHAARSRWINHGRYRFKGVPEPLPVFEIGEAELAPFRAPPWSSKAHREVPWWRRPATLIAEAAMLALVIGSVAWFALRPPPAIAFAQRDWVVIGSLKNLTTEQRFDDSLQTAFRIGMEQSRYVNVVPDLQVRDALKRMQRDPAKTEVDREVGTELALREGARALIMTSVAEIGGKVRVTAEVIDPKNHATVYSESRDGVGPESALESIDAIGKRVRERLGESLASIEADGQPLPKVTTQNLDALRAYAMGTKSQLDGRFKEAMTLYDEAIRLDPGFALAYTGKARIYISTDDRNRALESLTKALALREHLPPRESLYVDALAATFRSPTEMLERWKLFGILYPDAYYAHANYALFAWQYTNRYEDAIAQVKQSLSEHNPSINVSRYLLATLYLATDRLDEAQRELEHLSKLNALGLGLVLAETYAARRDFAQANAALAASHPSGVANNDIFRYVTRAALLADQGRHKEALGEFASALRETDAVGALYGRVFSGMELGVRSLLDRNDDYRAALRRFADAELKAIKREHDPDLNHSVFAAAFAAYLSAEADDLATARALIGEVENQARTLAYPTIDSMLLIAQAEVTLRSGKPQNAVAQLTAAMDGSELYLAHAVLMQAYAAAEKPEDALKEALWLSQHRGRAYGEYNSMKLLRPLNVATSVLALADAARYAQQLGRAEDAQRYAKEFDGAWPQADRWPQIGARLKATRAAASSR